MEKITAPFGVKVKRFINLGYHPKFEVTAGTSNFPKIYPGCYNYKPQKIISNIPSWKRQLEVEEFSKQLGYHGNHILKQRKWLNSVNGPAWHYVCSPSLENKITFPKAERYPTGKFKSFLSLQVPGPGTYGKNHVPHTRLEEKSTTKGFSFSILPSFEQKKCSDRDTNTPKSYHLPPNIYNIKSSIDKLVFKKTSKRGPYDLFSGERFPDKSINRSESLERKKNVPITNECKDLWKGKFLKCGKEHPVTSRIILKSKTKSQQSSLDPGPGYYNPFVSPIIRQKDCFKKSETNARTQAKYGIYPPLGRYNAYSRRRIKGDGFRSVFISKTKKASPQTSKWSWFE